MFVLAMRSAMIEDGMTSRITEAELARDTHAVLGESAGWR
jgi:hypothetical protein